LRADLVACRLCPGERIKVNGISEDLGVSLGAVREALSRLTSEGLVTSEPNKGFRASPLSIKDLRDLVNTRVQIEKICIRRVIALGDLDWEARVIAALHRVTGIEPGAQGNPLVTNEAWSDAHIAFHDTLVDVCDSPWLLRFRSQSWAQAERYGRLTRPIGIHARSKHDPDADHRAIAAKMIARDANSAVKLMTAHIHDSADMIFKAVNDGELTFPLEDGAPLQRLFRTSKP
jgi:DNA-binding GntR family transcriptional regulator